MSIEIKVPVIGESITEVTLVTWHKEDGEFVEEGDILCDIESDKATVELPAESSGVLKRSVEEGSDLPIGAVIGTLDTDAKGAAHTSTTTNTSSAPAASTNHQPTGENIDIKVPVIGESITEVSLTNWSVANGDFVNEGDILCEIESDKATVELPAESSGVITLKVEEGTDLPIGAVIASLAVSTGGTAQASAPATQESSSPAVSNHAPGGHASPAAKKILAEKGLDGSAISGTGKDGRITKADALAANKPAPVKQSAPAKKEATVASPTFVAGSREVKREKNDSTS